MATSRRIATVCGVLVLFAWSAPALASPPPGSACGDVSVSALNEYCERIPAAAGPQTPAPGMLAVGASLPTLIGNAAVPVSRKWRRRLAAVPARFNAPPLAGVVTDKGIVSDSLALILVLVALALILAALAYERRRRRRRVA